MRWEIWLIAAMGVPFSLLLLWLSGALKRNRTPPS